MRRAPGRPARSRTPSWPSTASTIETIARMAMLVRTKRKTRFTTAALLERKRGGPAAPAPRFQSSRGPGGPQARAFSGLVGAPAVGVGEAALRAAHERDHLVDQRVL